MKFTIAPNSQFETATPDEVTERLIRHEEVRQRARFEGKKYSRLNPPVAGIAAGGALSIGGDKPNPAGTDQPRAPQPGYCWLFRRIAVRGLTRGATPDVVWLYRRGIPVWEFNGNNWAYTFSFGEMVYYEGEFLALQNVGAFAATGQITLDGDYIETPQVKMFEALGGG